MHANQSVVGWLVDAKDFPIGRNELQICGKN
jgi:hypothetical protein